MTATLAFPMPDQPSLIESPRPSWWTPADEALVAEFYANGEAPSEQTERCRLCRHWLSADGWRGECHRAPLEVKPVTFYTAKCEGGAHTRILSVDGQRKGRRQRPVVYFSNEL